MIQVPTSVDTALFHRTNYPTPALPPDHCTHSPPSLSPRIQLNSPSVLGSNFRRLPSSHRPIVSHASPPHSITPTLLRVPSPALTSNHHSAGPHTPI
ncbi:hypothetical protein EX30DRAFT_342504 [Ascodesmis nigricans]|uniref:Uncharacterized protein n=1 Tax=Ascodesmis nigricans TaxID=341454 RepID=A0A4S2MS36_9PEZI|nr:hypothetical protein EX30DRAFT_342504 [Ascodesmis nigricans]